MSHYIFSNSFILEGVSTGAGPSAGAVDKSLSHQNLALTV